MNYKYERIRVSIYKMFPRIKIFRRCVSLVRKYNILHGTMLSSEVESIEMSGDPIANKKHALDSYKNRNLLDQKSREIQSLFNIVPKYLSRTKDELKTIEIDMLFSYIAYGIEPYEYLYCRFEGNDYAYRRQFISRRDQRLHHCVLNDLIDTAVVADKSYTYNKFQDFFGRDVVTISGRRDYDEFIRFTEKHPVFVKKEVYQNFGRGIDVINCFTYSEGKETLFHKLLEKGKTVLEEFLLQDGVLKELNPDSVNTVRIVTVNTRQGCEFAYSCLRIGRKGSYVDNAHSNGTNELGLTVGINVKTGVLETDGWNEHDECFITHPDSDLKLMGIQLPEWDRLLDIVKNCSKQLPTIKSVSWDLAYAYTETNPKSEWKIVEANGVGGNLYQVAYKQGFKAKMEELINRTDTMIRL